MDGSGFAIGIACGIGSGIASGIASGQSDMTKRVLKTAQERGLVLTNHRGQEVSLEDLLKEGTGCKSEEGNRKGLLLGLAIGLSILVGVGVLIFIATQQ